MEHGQFWERKVLSFVKRFDMDHDGFLTIKDYELMADRYEQIGKPGPEKANSFRKHAIEVGKSALKEHANGEPLSYADYVAARKQQSKETLAQMVTKIASLYFDMLDTNKNGYIEKKEFEIMFQMLGIDPGLSEKSFQMIDTNHDGRLSREEFTAAYVDFWTNEDEKSISQIFFGPLI